MNYIPAEVQLFTEMISHASKPFSVGWEFHLVHRLRSLPKMHAFVTVCDMSGVDKKDAVDGY